MRDDPTPCSAPGCYRGAERLGVLCPSHAQAARRAAKRAAPAPVPPPDLFGPPQDATAAPLTPYAGTSGHAGSEASEARAVAADSDGTTAARQGRALGMLAAAAAGGVTWAEVAQATGWHHGTASGTLSTLHRAGRVVRLAEQRAGSHVYVLPAYTEGRPTSARRATAGTRAALSVLEQVDAMLACGQVDLARAVISTARSALRGS